ncbi:MAG TPA: hypothetical protein VEH77_10215, partial [Roseiarcus sp.]|nr:hypothetical protein [Roseiarcus sp.]
QTTGEISPAPSSGDRRSGRIEVHHDYLLGLIRRSPDLTLLEIQERLIADWASSISIRQNSVSLTRREPPQISRRVGMCRGGFRPGMLVVRPFRLAAP